MRSIGAITGIAMGICLAIVAAGCADGQPKTSAPTGPAAVAAPVKSAPAAAEKRTIASFEQTQPIQLSDTFKRFKEPLTGRQIVQLTRGEAYCYPLYYYVPTFTLGGKYLIYHKSDDKTVQLWRLNLATGVSVQLSHADWPDTQWRPWSVPVGRGVMDYRSALNVPRGLVVYFDGPHARCVNVETLRDEPLFDLGDGREPTGQNCCTLDGTELIYIDSPKGEVPPKKIGPMFLRAYNFDTRKTRTIREADTAIHHVMIYDDTHLLICHPLQIVDIATGKRSILREKDPGVRGTICHHLSTVRGVAYEVPGVQSAGLYDPFTRKRLEWLLPRRFGYTHTGWDPEGRLFFYDAFVSDAKDVKSAQELHFLAKTGPDGEQYIPLTGPWPTFSGGQRGHMHPMLTPDRRWVLFTGGDPDSKTSHIFLVDVSDLKDSQGVTDNLLSPTGENDRTALNLPAAQLPADIRGKALPVKAATASAFQVPNAPANACDGDLNSLWAAEGDGQWIQFDLGEVRAVGKMLICWHSGDRRKAKFEVAFSADGKQWKTVFSGASSGADAGLENCPVAGGPARYIRLTGHGNSANKWTSIREVVFLPDEKK